MIHSMTAFASAHRIMDPWDVKTEIRSVNSRYLDIMIRVPHGYQSLEERIKMEISEKISRGRIEIHVSLSRSEASGQIFEVDENMADAYVKAWRVLQSRCAVEEPISIHHLLTIPGLIKPAEQKSDPEGAWPFLKACLQDAVKELIEMRRREGNYIGSDLCRRLEGIKEMLAAVETQSKGLAAVYHKRLMDRIEALTHGSIVVEPSRVAQEAAFFADRSDVSEELTRSASHLTHFLALMESPEPAGKKLNFLLQELNRELNTIGSKADQTTIAHLVVDMKAEIEKIREQVQNVE